MHPWRWGENVIQTSEQKDTLFSAAGCDCDDTSANPDELCPADYTCNKCKSLPPGQLSIFNLHCLHYIDKYWQYLHVNCHCFIFIMNDRCDIKVNLVIVKGFNDQFSALWGCLCWWWWWWVLLRSWGHWSNDNLNSDPVSSAAEV